MPAFAATVLSAALLTLSPSFQAASPPSDASAQELSARAKRAMETGQYSEAARIYRQLVTRIPDNAGLRLNLGIALESGGQHAAAVTELDRVVRDEPSLTAAWLMLGIARLNLDDTARAVPALEHAVGAEPSNRVARVELGDAYLQTGRPAQASAQFEAATWLDPASSRGWLGVARSYTALARAAFDRLDRDAPGSAYRSALLARARAAQQQYRSAFALYRDALARDPQIRGAHTGLAAIYRATGHDEWAATEDAKERAAGAPSCAAEPEACAFAAGRYHELVTASDTAPRALYWRSLAASQLALDAFTRLEALPPSPESHEVLAEAYRLRGLHHQAIQEWQAALARRPGDRRLKEELARSYWLNQDYAEARPLLEELLTQRPDSVSLNRELGDTLAQLQQPDAAIPYLTKAAAGAPDDVETRAALARALARAGRWGQATPHLEAVASSDRDGSLHRLLARAYAVAGRADDSAAAARRAEALASENAARQNDANAAEITAPQ